MDNYKVEVFTGIRPSGGLTIGNAIGAVYPIVKLQQSGEIGRPLVFVADLHGLTDKEPSETQMHVLDIVKDYISLGLDIENTDIFIQSQITPLIAEMNIYLSRLVTVAELMRIPTLKEKLRSGESESNANALLAMYPIMMASDILLQRAEYVPVGEDQVAHLEITRYLARKFNKKYGNVLAIPKVLSLGEPIRVLSLNGNGKMSKSDPSGAIVLDDPIEVSLKKVQRAQTAFAGESSDVLDTLVLIGKFVCNEDEVIQIDDIMSKHYAGENVMGDLKRVIMSGLERYLSEFQSKKANITDEYVLDIVNRGGEIARVNANEVLKDMRNVMGMRYIS